MELPRVAHTVPYQASKKEVADAVRSFSAWSAGGPSPQFAILPQHLLDLLNNQESSAAFLESLTGFINILLRGECPQEMRAIMFGGSLVALYPTPTSVRRVRRSNRLPGTGLQTISRKISQTLCRQRLSVEDSHEGGYSLHKGTAGSDQNGQNEIGWGYTIPMSQRKIHRLGFHCHPHVYGLLPLSVVIYTKRGCGTCCGSKA